MAEKRKKVPGLSFRDPKTPDHNLPPMPKALFDRGFKGTNSVTYNNDI